MLGFILIVISIGTDNVIGMLYSICYLCVGFILLVLWQSTGKNTR